ncbi:MAG TPA: hypothetical protein VN622_07620 [Clostridia bacterium]|nr:hypothetical protein [Clostridia bacterium]
MTEVKKNGVKLSTSNGESADMRRLASPATIRFSEAIAVAVLGLVVNLACAALLGEGHVHHHEDDHDSEAGHHPGPSQGHSRHQGDDREHGRERVIARWSYGLLRDTSAVPP